MSLKLIDANGRPLGSDAAQEEEIERVKAMQLTHMALLKGHPQSDLIVVAINMLCQFVKSGLPQEFPSRFEFMMRNLDLAMQVVAQEQQIQANVAASLAAGNKQDQPS